MKSVLLSFVTSLVCVTAFAGTGDVGSVGGVVPASVKSTSDKIEQFSPQGQAVTIAQLCQILAQDNMDFGSRGSKIQCIEMGNGLIELRGSSEKGALSIYANADDKTVFEAFGENTIQQYQNNLGQSLRVEFIMVTTSVKNVRGATQIGGYFRVDALMKNEDNRQLRVGYFSNL